MSSRIAGFGQKLEHPILQASLSVAAGAVVAAILTHTNIVDEERDLAHLAPLVAPIFGLGFIVAKMKNGAASAIAILVALLAVGKTAAIMSFDALKDATGSFPYFPYFVDIFLALVAFLLTFSIPKPDK